MKMIKEALPNMVISLFTKFCPKAAAIMDTPTKYRAAHTNKKVNTHVHISENRLYCMESLSSYDT